MRTILQRFGAYCKQIRERFFKFGIVGACGTVIDVGVIIGLNALFEETADDFIPRNIIQFAGYIISVFTNYLCSFFWVWKDRRGNFLINFFKYNISAALAFTLRIILFNLGMFTAECTGWKGMEAYYVIFFLSLGATVLINFLIINHKVFTGNRMQGS